jgi:glycosyltransferase involved in cell wall biosynthesis
MPLAAAVMEANLKVAYLLHRFPVLSETFIMRELYWIRQQGIDVTIFSLMPANTRIMHDQAAELLPLTQYSPYFSWEILRAQWHFVRRSPLRYLRAFATAIGQALREPLVMARALLLFPKSVYFAQQIQERGIEHIHTHFVWLGSIAASVAAELLDMPVTICPHAFDLFLRNPHDVREGLKAASQVVTISEYNRAFIAELCPFIRREEIEVIHCGVDTDHFQPGNQAHVGNQLRILSVGRLVETKGIGYVIEACKLLVERGLSLRCQIVGDGPLRAALQARIDQYDLQEHVTLRGALSQSDLLPLIQSSGVFALPATRASSGDQDGIPVSLMEAMACGLPVVTTSLSGIPELVIDGETGLLVQQHNAVDLANALERLASDEELRTRLGTQARRMIVDHFQLQRNTARLASLFKQVSRRHIPRSHTATVVEEANP